MRTLRMTGRVAWWIGSLLWGIAKGMVWVTCVLVMVMLLVVGVLAHFVGGPPQ